MNSSRNNSPTVSDNEETIVQRTGGRRIKAKPKRRDEPLEESSKDFIDLEYWTRYEQFLGKFLCIGY